MNNIVKIHWLERGFRYADYLTFFTKSGENSQEPKNKIDNFLGEKALNIKSKKLKLIY